MPQVIDGVFGERTLPMIQADPDALDDSLFVLKIVFVLLVRAPERDSVIKIHQAALSVVFIECDIYRTLENGRSATKAELNVCELVTTRVTDKLRLALILIRDLYLPITEIGVDGCEPLDLTKLIPVVVHIRKRMGIYNRKVIRPMVIGV